MITMTAPTLLAAGKKAWAVLASVDFITDNDYFVAKEFCENLDEITSLQKIVKKEGLTISTNNNSTIMLHPLRREINDLKKVNRELLREMGMSVKQRRLLLLGEENENNIVNVLQKALENIKEGD